MEGESQNVKEKQALEEKVKYLEQQLRDAQEKLKLAGDKSNSSNSTLPPATTKKARNKKSNKNETEQTANKRRKRKSVKNQDPDFPTYEKRSGTLDHGKEYEYLMSAFCALKFCQCESVLDFKMTTNNEIYGDFDDLEVTITFKDQTSKTLLIQLKHFDDERKTVTTEMLTATNAQKQTATQEQEQEQHSKQKKNFSLSKYLTSFRTLHDRTNIECIISTNINSDLKNDSRFTLEDKEIVIKEIEISDTDHLLDTTEKTKKESCRIFQFEPIQTETENVTKEAKEMEEFFKKFYLITNQSNCKAIEASIEKALDEMLGCKVLIAFVNFMHHWWKGKFVLTKHDVIAKLSELLLSPFIQEISNSTHEISLEKSEMLKNAMLSFDITIAKDSDAKIISEIWGKTTPLNVVKISKASLKYGITTTGFSNLNKLSPSDLSKALWYLNEVPLLIKFNEAEKIQVNKAIKLLEPCKKAKKLLLLGNISRDELPQWKVFETLSDIWNLEVCSEIKTKFKLSLQGREPISLSELIGEDLENAKIIEVKELVIMSQQTFVVAKNEEVLPESYVPRSVSTTFLNTNAILDSYNSQKDLLIFNCNKEYQEEMTHRNIDTIDIQHYLSDNNITLKNKKLVLTSLTGECLKWEFDEICKKAKRNVYLLKIIDETASILVCSNSNISILERYKIDRCPIEEDKIYTTLKNPLNAITALPGMGKSTLITYLSRNCPFDHWCIRINLIKYNSFLRAKPTTEKLLSRFMELDKLAKDPFLHRIVTYFLSIKKLYFFLDGLDEIESCCVDLVLSFVVHSKGVKVWISSRTNLEELIIKHLKVYPIYIKELEEEQQKKYIEDRLRKKFEFNQIQTITTTLLTSADVSNSQQLLGIPLQLFIITENFLNNKEFYQKLDEDIFLLTKMYEIFFKDKRRHQYKKLGVEDYQYQLDDNFDDRLKHYEHPALKSSLDSETFEKLHLDLEKSDAFLTKLKKNGDKFAIISLVTDNNEAVFVHQTYAEYFACKWFKKNIDKLLLIKNEFFLARYQNLKKIFDIMLAEKNPLHLATIYQNPKQFEKHKHKIHEKDEGGRTPLHLICSHGEKFKNYFAPYTRATTIYTNMFRDLLVLDPFECDRLFEWNCLDYALKSECLYPFEAILEKHPESVEFKYLLQRLGNNLCAFYCSYFGYLNLLNKLLKKDPKIIDSRDHNHRSLLHLALEGYFDNNEMALKEKNVATFRELAKITKESDKNEIAELACESNDYVILDILLKNGTNVNSTDYSGMSMLYLVSLLKNSNTEVLQLLLKYGAEVNAAVNSSGNTALHAACASGNYNAAKFLIDNGALVNYTNPSNKTALHFATKRRSPSNADLVKMLIDEGANINAIESRLGYTALHEASSYGAYDLIELLLLEQDISVNTTTKQQETPLHLISSNSRYDNKQIIEKLIDKGINVDALNKKRYTALHIACQSGNYGTVEVLLDRKADININDKADKCVLHSACRNSDTQILELLIDRGVNINFRDQDGYTPLHEACNYGNYDAVKMLLARGADIRKTSKKNETILHCAAKQEKADATLIQLLIDTGVDITIQDEDGNTALHLACISRNFDSIKKLIKNGASVDAIDRNGHTPLHLACKFGDYNTVKYLLDNKASTNTLTFNNETVLHMILNQEEPETEVIKLLIDNKADVNVADKNGYTPLLLASKHGEYDTIQMLLEKGAEVNAITNNGDTVLHLAVKRTEKDIMKILIEKSDSHIINTVNKKGESVLYLSYTLKCWKALKMLLKKGVVLDSLMESLLVKDFTTIFYEGRVELIQLILSTVSIDKINIKIDLLPPEFPVNLMVQNGSLQAELLLKMADAIHKIRQSFSPRCCPDDEIIDYITKIFCENSNEEAFDVLQNRERSRDDDQRSRLHLPVSFMDEMKKELRRKKRNCE